MKKLLAIVTVVFLFVFVESAMAAETSTDKLVLTWNTEKVWMDKGNLCMQGTFRNTRSDINITALNHFVTRITFTRSDGKKEAYTCEPLQLPTCNIPAGGSRRMSFKLGAYTGGPWSKWVTEEEYLYTYHDAMFH